MCEYYRNARTGALGNRVLNLAQVGAMDLPGPHALPNMASLGYTRYTTTHHSIILWVVRRAGEVIRFDIWDIQR